jgi:hypothetical protein
MKRALLKRKNAPPPSPKRNKHTLGECIVNDITKAVSGNAGVKEGTGDECKRLSPCKDMEQRGIKGTGQSDSSTEDTRGVNDGQKKEMTLASQGGTLALQKSSKKRPARWECSSCNQLQLSSMIEQTTCSHCIKDRGIGPDIKVLANSNIVLTSPAEPVKPQVNDVLIGSGTQIFNHIGNRRFRVLIEANFDRYFNPNASGDAREAIVNNIIRSISSNLPAGKFLAPLFPDANNGEDNAAWSEGRDVHAILWKRASQKETEAKVYSAFLAAGCFFVSRAAALQQMEERVPQAVADQHSAEKDDAVEDVKDEDCLPRDSSARVVSSQSDASIEKVVPLPDQGAGPIPCPPRLKEFARQPIANYFVLDSPPSESSPYLVPSHYDILCGSGQNYFHHIGNRRFRILVETSVHRYHEAFCKPEDPTASEDKDNSIQKLVTDTLVSLSKCDPPGRKRHVL